jgi:hypothetical protein
MKGFNPVPKPPANKPKRKKQNGWKGKAERHCFYCDSPYAERHEVYGGANRQISIERGFQVDLCMKCHREMTENLTQRAQERNQYWKQHYQRQYEEKLKASGVSAQQAREMWMQLIGKNFLEEVN